MKSHEAIQRAIAGRTVEHAKRLGKSTVLLHKWQEPSTDYSDSGMYNPLDRIEAIVDEALILGIDREDALAPVYWLNHRFGLVCFDLPDAKGGAIANELLTTIKEFADLAQATSEALLDKQVTRMEAGRIISEGEQALRAIGALIGAVKEIVK